MAISIQPSLDFFDCYAATAGLNVVPCVHYTSLIRIPENPYFCVPERGRGSVRDLEVSHGWVRRCRYGILRKMCVGCCIVLASYRSLYQGPRTARFVIEFRFTSALGLRQLCTALLVAVAAFSTSRLGTLPDNMNLVGGRSSHNVKCEAVSARMRWPSHNANRGKQGVSILYQCFRISKVHKFFTKTDALRKTTNVEIVN